ncbi:uncharacterized protein cldnl3 [Hydra vulgaris]|uniref:Claudin-like 3 n=1 Tax=Hydra vulgaris TaxID=6087 RepID=A0A0H5FMD0_HYDVU|nr:uncharacterized protein cldnl3 [Hydra vulgaris]XP_012561036.1 uncharacterized protein cldnl3 [Hydra vulgaris]XP_047128181.1 uncharacterized protein cldnl3 [Hydra vulgaris]XP_047128182.1 uncharacterized protein cldnl3 [Hydra vulgaris]XP_047128183.1 uncharacterized protein cldnl3 [Hydra vulgaris]CRX73247.1 Claudin-like 3 [Hydra vulgaris]
MRNRPWVNVYVRPISYIFLFLTLAVTFIAFCTPYWYSEKQENGERYFGVWTICMDASIKNCTFLPNHSRSANSDSRLTAIRALFSMSIMHLVGAIGYPPFFKQMSNGILNIGFMALLSLVSGLFSLASMAIMTYEISCYKFLSYGYSYFLGWIGTSLSFVAASLVYVASKDNSYSEIAY